MRLDIYNFPYWRWKPRGWLFNHYTVTTKATGWSLRWGYWAFYFVLPSRPK